MATYTFYSFNSHFPVIDNVEVAKLLAHIVGKEGLEDIYQLARSKEAQLAQEVEVAPDLFKNFWSALKVKAAAIATAHPPTDPSAPTPEEMVIMDGMYPEFFSNWPDSKRATLNMVIFRVTRAKKGLKNSFQVLEAIGKMSDGEAKSLLNDSPFYETLASYYITAAKRYIQKSQKTYHLTGRVLDQNSTPKGQVETTVEDRNVAVSRSFGATYTNTEGYYRVTFQAIEIDSKYDLHIRFDHFELNAPEDRVLTYEAAKPNTVFTTTLEFTATPSASTTIAAAGTPIPADVQSYLSTNGLTVQRLDDIRRLGGFKNLPSEAINKGNPALLKLDALANLELISDDLAKNNTLYDRGYSGISDIATTSRRAFLRENADVLGDYEAGRIHVEASAGMRYALNQYAGTHSLGPAEEPSTDPAHGSSCGCEDCASAVSPLAYLADLLLYTTKRVEHDGEEIDLTFLEQRFFQEFGNLPNACSQLEQTICQNRIAAEILRKYLIENQPTTAAAAILATAEKRYLVDAYRLLLLSVGTTYEELRRIQHETDEDERRKLSDRIGIVLVDEEAVGDPVTLETLFIDLSNTANITEVKLMELFGLRDSNLGMLESAPESLMLKWTKAFLENRWKEQDGEDDDYVLGIRPVVDPDIVTVDDLRFPESSNDAFEVWLRRRNWVDGLLPLASTTIPESPAPGIPTIDHSAVDGTITVYEPGTLTIEVNEIFTYSKDGFTKDYTVKQKTTLAGDLVLVVEEPVLVDRAGGTITVAGQTAHTNDKPRTYESPSLRALLEGMHNGATYTQSGGSAVTVTPGTGWLDPIDMMVADLRARAVPVRQGDETAIAELWTELRLFPAELLAIIEFIDGFAGYPADGLHAENNYTTAEWGEFRDVLLAAFKRGAWSTWITEEQTLGVSLGPADFMASLVAPKAGPWPLEREVDIPLLDPDKVVSADLPEVTTLRFQPFDLIDPDNYTTTLQVLDGRRAELIVLREGIVAAHTGSTDLPALLNHVYTGLATSPFPDVHSYCVDLLTRLGSSITSTDAITEIQVELHLSVDEFQFMMRLDGAGPHAVKDLERMYSFLTRVKKEREKYPTWYTDEVAVAGWKIRKANLPKWSAKVEERKAWLRALEKHSDRPLIDADLIGPGDLADPSPGNIAFDRWKLRYLEMHDAGGWLNTLSIALAAVSDTAGYDQLTKDALGHAESSLAELDVQREDGVDIRPRLAQLSLTSGEFNFLNASREVITGLTDEEKTDITRVLAQVRKRRKFFTYRTEEWADGISLTPLLFKEARTTIGQFPAQPEHPLVAWLASDRDLILWRRALKGRIAQRDRVLDSIAEKVVDVDGDMVLHLRDALVKATGRGARELGDSLLIDMENTCCYKTNRIAQATETILQLLWKLRTGDVPPEFDLIDLSAEDFDQAWTWMGSYANWRAAMFVFLYPENVLIPSLRKEQTVAFRDVIEATRNNRRFGPDNACNVAKAYQAYLKDITMLEVKCAAETDLYIRDKGCGDQNSSPVQYNFVFAQSRANQKAYYALVDARTAGNHSQHRFWAPIPVLDEKARIFACDIYHPGSQKFIYLFYLLDDTEKKDKFYALRFDQLSGQWEEEALEFTVEQDDLFFREYSPAGEYQGFKKEDFSTEIKSIAVRQVNAPWRAPMVGISLEKTGGISKEVYTFTWTMHDNGTEFKARWNNDGWELVLAGNKALKGSVRSFSAVVDDEPFDDSGHSVLVLRSKASYQLNPAWTVWRSRLDYWYHVNANFEEYFDNDHLYYWDPIWPNHIDIPETFYQSIRVYLENNQPIHYFEDHFTASDTLVYIHHGEGTIYKPSWFGDNSGKEVISVVRFYDERTLHLEVDETGDRYAMVVHFTEDPSVPLIMSIDQEGLSPFNLNTRVIAPVQHYQISTNADHEDLLGGNLVHQLVTEDQLGVLYYTRFAKTYNEGSPELSVLHLTPPDLPLTLSLDTPPQIQSEFTEEELSLRRVISAAHVLGNGTRNPRLIDYLYEVYYFVPLQLGLQLSANGHYQRALDWFTTIYSFHAPFAVRKIWYGLRSEELGEPDPYRVADWYADPLNPHAIAASRPHVYTRYTILCIAQCLLDYADAEYTADNSESVPRARELYEDALDLIQLLKPEPLCPLDEAMDELSHYVELTPWYSTWVEVMGEAQPLSGDADFPGLLTTISNVMSSSDPIEERIAEIRTLIHTALDAQPQTTFATQLEEHGDFVNALTEAALGRTNSDTAAQTITAHASVTYRQVMERTTGYSEPVLQTMDLPWLGRTSDPLEGGYGEHIEVLNPGRTEVIERFGSTDPASAFLIDSPFPDVWISGMPFSYCVVPNPIVEALLLKAHVNLFKIHNCMNIAGMVRELAPFAAPTDSTSGIPVIGVGGTLAIPTDRQIPPSAYRYRVIVERAKQLVAMAQQVEGAFLSALEKLDAERYSKLRAEQDIESSKASIKLQDLKVKEATDGVKLAELQRDRSQLQVDGLQSMIDEGLIGSENLLVGLYANLAAFKILIAVSNTVQAAANATIAASGAALGPQTAIAATAAVTSSVAGGISLGSQITVAGLESGISIASLFASFERRKQEWEFQKTLATQDVKIGDQGVKIAQDRVQISGQERTIAALQNEHAKATLDFLKNKFTSAEMYEWMSGVLEDVYAFFLQEATSLALMAQRQLSFERQVDLPPFIRTDY